MSEGIGLGAGEIRAVRNSIGVSMMVVSFGRARWDWREENLRERARRRRLLRGGE